MSKNTKLGSFADEYHKNAYSNVLPNALQNCITNHGGSIPSETPCLTVTNGVTRDVNGIDISTNLIISDGLLKFKAGGDKNDKNSAAARCNRNSTCVGVGQKPDGDKWNCLYPNQSSEGKPLSFYSNPEITKQTRINASITYDDLKNHINKISYDSTVDSAFIDDYLDFRTSMGNIQLDGNNNATYTSDVLENTIKPAFETTKNKHKEVKELRNELDNKMRELYGEKGDPDLNLDSSVYSTMLFTIMTTSLLYFLFVKM
jgi:hypothetical protein